MNIFVIGATGYVGGHVARELVAHGHDVIGFARGEDGAAALARAGVTPWIGDMAAIEAVSLKALEADATVFAPQLTSEEEHGAVSGLLSTLAGSGKTFVFTSGTGLLSKRTSGAWDEESFAEDDPFTPLKFIALRYEVEQMVRGASGVRGIVIRPPAIWGGGTHGITDLTAESVKKVGAACYIGRGTALYSHVHVEDLAVLYRLAIEKAPAGALYHAVAGELDNRCIAEFVAKRLGVATRSVTMDEAFDIWGRFFTLVVLSVSCRSRSPRSREELGWVPEKVDLAEEILSGDILTLTQGSPHRTAAWRK